MLKAMCLIGAAILATETAASAHGALAIGGAIAKVAENGIAVGVSVDHQTPAEARTAALERCRAFQGSKPEETTAHCAVVAEFSHKWAAVVLDSKPNTPGFGWSIDADKATAERKAMEQCKATSPADRKAFCASAGAVQDAKP
jgi:hypothetical protein